MPEFSGYKEELDAIKVLQESLYSISDELMDSLTQLLIGKFENVVYYFDPSKPIYSIEAIDSTLENFELTYEYCNDLLNSETTVGRKLGYLSNSTSYLRKLIKIKDSLSKYIESVIKLAYAPKILKLEDVPKAETYNGIYTFTSDCEMCVITTDNNGGWYGSHIGNCFSPYSLKAIDSKQSMRAQFRDYLTILIKDGKEVKKYHNTEAALMHWTSGYDPSEA